MVEVKVSQIEGCWRKTEIPSNYLIWFFLTSYFVLQFSSVQLLSCVRLFVTPWTAACQAPLSITNSQSPPKPMSIESVMPSSHLILYSPLLLLPSIFPGIRVFSSESALHIRWPKYWSFIFNISPSNEYPGLIFRMGWLDLLAVQGTLKSLLQHHNSKASILRCSAFFSFSLSAIRVVSSAYLKLLIFLPSILIPVCASSSPTFPYNTTPSSPMCICFYVFSILLDREALLFWHMKDSL